MSYQQFKQDFEKRRDVISKAHDFQDCKIDSLELIYIHPNLKTAFQKKNPNNPDEVKYIIALLPYDYSFSSYRHSRIELIGFFDAAYNKIPTIPLVDDWEICGIKEHGGSNLFDWVSANLVIRNLPLFKEKEIEVPNCGSGVRNIQSSLDIIWEYIGEDKIPSPTVSIESPQETIERLQEENKKLKIDLAASEAKLKNISMIINDIKED